MNSVGSANTVCAENTEKRLHLQLVTTNLQKHLGHHG